MNIFNAISTNRIIAFSFGHILIVFLLKQNGLGSIFTLPPRPKISRSFSFSESSAPRKVLTGLARLKGKSEGREEETGRSQSVYGLQSPGLSWIDSLGSPPPPACPNCSESLPVSSYLQTSLTGIFQVSPKSPLLSQYPGRTAWSVSSPGTRKPFPPPPPAPPGPPAPRPVSGAGPGRRASGTSRIWWRGTARARVRLFKTMIGHNEKIKKGGS